MVIIILSIALSNYISAISMCELHSWHLTPTPKGSLGHSTCWTVPSIPNGAANNQEALVYRVIVNAMCYESSDRMPSTRPHMFLFLAPTGMHLLSLGVTTNVTTTCGLWWQHHDRCDCVWLRVWDPHGGNHPTWHNAAVSEYKWRHVPWFTHPIQKPPSFEYVIGVVS